LLKTRAEFTPILCLSSSQRDFSRFRCHFAPAWIIRVYLLYFFHKRQFFVKK
jgi:hypothetical protein